MIHHIFTIQYYALFRTKIGNLAKEIADNEPLVTQETRRELENVLRKIQNTAFALSRKPLYQQRVLETHLLSLTNIAMDPTGKL